MARAAWENGLFRYRYDGGAIPVTLHLNWKRLGRSTFELRMVNGANPRTCSFEIKGDQLKIHDGNAKSCIPTEPHRMPVEFVRPK